MILPIKAVHQHFEQDTPRLHAVEQGEVSTITSSSDELTPEQLHEFFEVSAYRETPDGQPDLVLAIDDNPDTIVIIKAMLKDTPYSVVGVQDPLKAMELAQKLHPCAIMLDVLMPDYNGWQILHQLKADPATASIPVGSITVLAEPTTGYVLGADDYRIKPFRSDVLLNTLRRLIVSSKGSSLANKREIEQV